MRILAAFDKFKDNMTAQTACQRALDAAKNCIPEAETFSAPLTDGGEGFCSIMTETAGGQLQHHSVCGPQGKSVQAELGYVDASQLPEGAAAFLNIPSTGKVAIIEMAQAAGLQDVPYPERDPWKTTTYGVGEQLKAAAAAGASSILLGVGGSATNDIGLGALQALGLRLGDLSETAYPEKFDTAWALDKSELTPLPPLRIACDVKNPLCGPKGATATFGPQKGLKSEDFERLESTVRSLGESLCSTFGKSTDTLDTPGAGAAGGIAFGLMTAYDAKLIPGFDLVKLWIGLEPKIDAADIVITGEGKFDGSTLDGKGPGAVVNLALAKGKQVAVFAGALDEKAEAAYPGVPMSRLSSPDTPLQEALKQGPENMTQIATAYFKGITG